MKDTLSLFKEAEAKVISECKGISLSDAVVLAWDLVWLSKRENILIKDMEFIKD